MKNDKLFKDNVEISYEIKDKHSENINLFSEMNKLECIKNRFREIGIIRDHCKNNKRKR